MPLERKLVEIAGTVIKPEEIWLTFNVSINAVFVERTLALTLEITAFVPDKVVNPIVVPVSVVNVPFTPVRVWISADPLDR